MTKMAALIASTIRERSKIDWAGAEAGAKMFVGLSGEVACPNTAPIDIIQFLRLGRRQAARRPVEAGWCKPRASPGWMGASRLSARSGVRDRDQNLAPLATRHPSGGRRARGGGSGSRARHLDFAPRMSRAITSRSWRL